MSLKKPHTGCCELSIETFAHDTLETHAGADAPDGDKREGVGPSWVTPIICYAARVALPECDRGDHGEDGLDECTECHPHACLAPDLITDTPDECAKDEGEDGTERLLVGNVEGVVMLTVEEPCQG